MIGILTDSTADLPQEMIERYDIEVAALYINMSTSRFFRWR